MFHAVLGLRRLGLHLQSREATCGNIVQSSKSKIVCCGCFRQVVRRYIAPGVAMGCGASRAHLYTNASASFNAEIALIVQESAGQTDRIPFYGSEPENFREGEQAIVSFPGVHGYGWKKLTEVASKKETPFASSCIFLPDEETPGWGRHDNQRGGHCSCHFLYNMEMKWGCHWFSQWKEQTFRAHSRQCNLVVVTKKDGTLGRSQAGEVRWLVKEKIPYESITIEQFARRIFDPTPVPSKAQRQKSEKQARKQQENKMRAKIEADVRREMQRSQSNSLLRRDSEEDGLDNLQYNAI